MISLKYKKLSPDVQPPEKKHTTDAAFDLRAFLDGGDICILPYDTVAINTGLVFDILKGYEVEVYSRSGLALNGIQVANSPGTIDSGYTGEVKVILYNSSAYPVTIYCGDRIAQIKMREVLNTLLIEVSDIKDTDRSSAGLGSTGIK